jgi:hypothetical protein
MYRESWKTRLAAAALLLAADGLYHLCFTPPSFPLYYFIVGFWDGAMIGVLRWILGSNSLTHDLQRIKLAWVFLHAFGFVLYMLYLPPFVYDFFLKALKVLEWARLFMVRNVDKSPKNSWRFDLVRGHPDGGQKRFARTENL